ncbi:MAG: GNAT family N-acetyltransferase [Pseudomonadota bacterium]
MSHDDASSTVPPIGTLVVRTCSTDDVDLLVPLFAAIERDYEGAAAIAEPLIRERLAVFLAGHAPGTVLVAVDERALGFVTLFEVFPGQDLGRTWFVKDIFVLDDARSRGVGDALMRAAARTVLDRGGSRLDLATGDDNHRAQRFYTRLGGAPLPRVFYRFEEQALGALAELPPAS